MQTFELNFLYYYNIFFIIFIFLLLKYEAEYREFGGTALHLAITNKDIEFTKYLIEVSKADPNNKDKRGRTALHLAISNKCIDIVEYLIEISKADPNIKIN